MGWKLSHVWARVVPCPQKWFTFGKKKGFPFQLS
jgi:hypothetical protein